MIFHGLSYAVFLPLVLMAFWALAPFRRVRTVLLLAASYVFYGSWEPWFLGLIVFSTVLDFVCGRIIGESDDARVRKRALLASLGGNLGVLAFFKYWDWGIESLAALLAGFGLQPSLPLLGIAVPVGISFYTFQTLSYTIDIYRGQLAPRRSPLEFALFVAFFPQLVAGPIVRAVHFLPQLDLVPRFDRRRLHDGLWFIALGLGKKVLIADVLARTLVDPVYDHPEAWGAAAHLLALYAFTFQIYGDFAGYSDIAIGSARLLGFDLPENFRTPFRSRSVREFWQRWHISLSTWVRDYVYFPLGGSRVAPLKIYRNLLVTMVLIGLWHGASSLWLIYGVLNGIAMSLERVTGRGEPPPARDRASTLLRWFVTYHFVVVTLLLVRGTSLSQVGDMLTVFGGESAIPPWGLAALAAAVAGHFLPDLVVAGAHRAVERAPTLLVGLLFGAFCAAVAVVNIGETPYIYFQF